MDQPSTQQPSSATLTAVQPPVQYAIAPGQVPAVYPNPGIGQPTAVIAGQPPAGYAAVPQALPGYQHVHQQQLQQFWNQQMQEIEQLNDFRTHQLPLARIKKIMKADEDVRMIAAEAPVLFAKACEMFILELTLRSWINTEENRRRTLQKNDIAAAISRTDIFDFLVDIVPRDEQEGLGMPRPGLPVGAPGEVPYGGMYYMAQPQVPGAVPVLNQSPQTMIASPAIIVGRPAVPVDPAMYRPGIPYAPQPAASPQQNWQPKTQESQSEAAETSS